MNPSHEHEKHNSLLSEFGRHHGIPDLAFDDEDRCVLRFDAVELNLEYQADRSDILIFTEIGKLAAMNSPDAALRLLHGNLASASLGTGTIGVDRKSGSIVWFDRVTAFGIDQPLFRSRIQDALGWIGYWRHCLSGPAKCGPEPMAVEGTVVA